MQGLKVLLSEAWISTTIGIGGIIVGAILSYLFYKKSQQGAKLSYQMNSTRIINREIEQYVDGINISFRGKEIEKLSKSYIFLWNSGMKTINGSDIVSSNKLRIKLIDGEILSTNIAKVSREVNSISIKLNNLNKQEAEIFFDFLDPKDGVVIEILHTSSVRYPLIDGVIKGIPKGFTDSGVVTDISGKTQSNVTHSKRLKLLYLINRSKKLSAFTKVGFSLILILSGIYWDELPTWWTEVNPTFMKWFSIIFGFICSILVIPSLIIRRQKFPKLLELNNLEL